MRRLGWWGVPLLLLAAMAVAMLTSARLENQTWDEGIHLSAGYSYLRLGDYRLNWETPPLGRILCALPLLAADPRLPTEHDSWRNGDAVLFGAVFLYRNLLQPDTMLMLGRLPTMLLTLLFGALLAAWSRKRFGPVAAVFTVFFFALDPNMIAHGRYVTTDVLAALTIFLTVIGWARYLESGRWPDLLWTGLALGLALATKFSALFLIFLLPALYLIRWWQAPKRHSALRVLRSSLAVMALAAVVVLAAYGPESVAAFSRDSIRPLTDYATGDSAVSRALHFAGETLNLPAHRYLTGLNIVAEHNKRGHPASLLGEVSESGAWYYFPVAMAVKTPTALLLLLLLAAGSGVWSLRSSGVIGHIRRAPFQWVLLVVVPAVYLLFAMSSSINLGLRHILPIYPFLFVLAAAVLARQPAWWLIVLVAGAQVCEVSRIHPNYLSFFNSLSGGPARGSDYLVDSNLDWGQDIKKLAAYQRERQTGEILIDYFGVTDLHYYLDGHRNLNEVWDGGGGEDLNRVVAISATILKGGYQPPERYRWFREREPDATIGHSLYVYDLRKRNR